MNPQEQPQGFVSIERVVAFVVGPLLVIGSGWASAWLARHVPGAPPLPAEAATIAGGAVSVTVGGLAYKWLHGRQKMLPEIQQVIHDVTGIPGVSDFASQVETAVEVGVAKALKQPMPTNTAEARAAPDEPIPAAANDPAPASMDQVADVGAVSTS
jgi:hypothetical protein